MADHIAPSLKLWACQHEHRRLPACLTRRIPFPPHLSCAFPPHLIPIPQSTCTIMASQKEECGAAHPIGARHAGRDGLKLSVDAAMNADQARALLCGGADVLACTIRFSPEIAPRWRARRRVGLPGPHLHRHQDGARPGARWQRRNTHASLQRPCRRGTFSWAATTAATRKR
jgi:hypothetical protein